MNLPSFFGRAEAPAPAAEPATEARPVRVVIFTSQNAPTPAVLEKQRATIAEYCEAHGYEVAAHIQGGGEGNGNNAPRPKLREALAMIEEGKADAVAVASLGRLAKSTPHLMDMLAEHFEHGPRLISVAEGVTYPDNPGPMMRVLLRSVMEAVVISPANVKNAPITPSVKKAPPKPPENPILKRIAEDNERKRLASPEYQRQQQDALEQKIRDGRAQMQAAHTKMDAARAADPTYDEKVAEKQRIQAERDAQIPILPNPPRWGDEDAKKRR